MRILVNSDGYVDFEAPIYMEEDYQKKLIDFFKAMFPGEIEVEEVEEKVRVSSDRETKPEHHWVPEDYSLLLSGLDNVEVAKKLNVSPMAVVMKRGPFFHDFFSWMRKKGYKQETIQMIDEYFKEMKETK